MMLIVGNMFCSATSNRSACSSLGIILTKGNKHIFRNTFNEEHPFNSHLKDRIYERHRFKDKTDKETK